jgi:protein-arginine kinase
MDIHTFLSSPADFTRRTGPNDRIVLSSRVRLARNIN